MTAETNTMAKNEATIFFTPSNLRVVRLTSDETFVFETPFLRGVSREYGKSHGNSPGRGKSAGTHLG